MDSTELKQAIVDDIETLKNLELEIMPFKEYWNANLTQFGYVFLKIYLAILGNIFISNIFNPGYFRGTFRYVINKFFCDAIIIFGETTFIMFFVYSQINLYVILKNQLRSKLKTGNLLIEKIELAAKIAYGIFTATIVIAGIFYSPDGVPWTALAGVIVTAFLINSIVEMEINRIGISTLLTILNQYFEKKKAS